MDWIINNWEKVLQIFGAVVAAISIFMKLFATEKTQGVWAKILKVLSILSLVNPDGSLIGRKEEEKK